MFLISERRQNAQQSKKKPLRTTTTTGEKHTYRHKSFMVQKERKKEKPNLSYGSWWVHEEIKKSKNRPMLLWENRDRTVWCRKQKRNAQFHGKVRCPIPKKGSRESKESKQKKDSNLHKLLPTDMKAITSSNLFEFEWSHLAPDCWATTPCHPCYAEMASPA